VLSCPTEWAETYKRYMIHHDIPLKEELADGKSCFLLPPRYRPRAWKLDNEGS
jgi:hypothetical protein